MLELVYYTQNKKLPLLEPFVFIFLSRRTYIQAEQAVSEA
jgi:hypothetical protein